MWPATTVIIHVFVNMYQSYEIRTFVRISLKDFVMRKRD